MGRRMYKLEVFPEIRTEGFEQEMGSDEQAFIAGVGPLFNCGPSNGR